MNVDQVCHDGNAIHKTVNKGGQQFVWPKAEGGVGAEQIHSEKALLR
jgi:hypothetical protein